jgi:restriction endonuclease S subunit
MAVFSIVKLSELEGAKRIDAEYYKPDYLEIDQKIKRLKHFQFKQIISSFSSGKNLPQIECCKDCKDKIDYIRTQNVRPILIDKEGLTCINPQVQNSPLLEEGDLLFVRVGEGVGNSSIITSEWANSSYSDNVIRIKIRYLDPYFVIVFLNSNVGKKYLERVKKGSARSLISKENINLIKIFEPSLKIAQYCRDTIKEAQSLIANSESIYSQAESLLLEELGLKDLKPKYEKTYTAKLSDEFSAHRIDAEYFQPAYEEVIKLLMKKVKVEKLKNVASFISHGKQPYYVENGDIPVLIQKHLGSQLLSLYSEIVNMPDTPRTDREFVKKYPEYLIKPFDVLFYSVGAYLGRANVVLENFEAVPASFITLIRTKQEVCNPVYLALFLNSKIGQLQSSRWKSASAQQYIYPKEIKEFIIPILPLSIQQEIASLVQQSHEARKKAKELLELAKRAVEIAIEEGEEKAINFLSRIKYLLSTS